MPKYRRRDGVVDVVEWSPGTAVDGVRLTAPDRGSLVPRGILKTPTGSFVVNAGDRILTGADGRRWVVEAAMFPDLYEPAE